MSHPQILLVEDNPAHMQILEDALGGIEASLLKATAGKEALARLHEHAGIALIIADLHMAEMSGFELIEGLRQEEALAHIPVIVVSGVYTTTAHMLRGYHVGAVDYLLKPLQPVILQHKVNHFLRQHAAQLEVKAECQRLSNALLELGVERKALVAALQKKSAETNVIFGQQHNLATISHEIRTPLNAILNFCSLLDDEDDLTPRERHDYMERIKNNGKHLSRIVDDIINLARSEAHKLKISKTHFALLAEIDSVVESFMLLAAKKGVTIVKKIGKGVPTTVFSDATRFKQVLINLLDNAVKFTDQGYIVIDIRPTLSILNQANDGAEENVAYGPQAGLEVRVTDTGCGVADNELASIFEPFRQGGSTLLNRQLGSGLGLTLSHHIAKLLGGDLVLEDSELGKGSTFCFSMATSEAPEPLEHDDRSPTQLMAMPPRLASQSRGAGAVWWQGGQLRKNMAEFFSYIQTFLTFK